MEVGELLPRLSILTLAGGLFLLHFPGSYLRLTLSATLPCEARTFLAVIPFGVIPRNRLAELPTDYSTKKPFCQYRAFKSAPNTPQIHVLTLIKKYDIMYRINKWIRNFVSMTQKTNVSARWWILAAGVATMLFAGIIYAWSILKTPFASELGFEPGALALNFTLTMCFFCLGGFVSGRLVRRIGTRLTLVAAGILAGIGFVLTSRLGGSAISLYITYAFLAGLGIGISYITIISTVNSWFPDRRGFSSGALMMGFGASTLLFGKIADALFATDFGWRSTYVVIGVAIAVVVVLSSFVIKAPAKDAVLSEKKKNARTNKENFEARDYTPAEMVRRFTFWRAFLALVCLTAVGSSVISFARDLALSVGAEAALATTLVGVLSVCNGLGRIITGAVFDSMGRRFTMISASVLTMCAAGVTLFSVKIGSLPLCVIGLCLTGLSYGTSPTVSSAFTSAFYGQKHFATNLSISNFNLMFASFIATACSSLQVSSGGYTLPFVLLLTLSAVSFVLNISIKKP